MAELLFEIGLEEMPSNLIDESLKNLEKLLLDELKKERIEFKNVKTYQTPRRLTISLELSEKQSDLNLERKGPLYSLCYDNNNLTLTGKKFLDSISLDHESINIEKISTDKGDYIYVKKFLKGDLTKHLLPKILLNVIESMKFEKNMKWSTHSFRFIRPIKWLLSIFNKEIIPLEFLNIKSSNKTRALRIFKNTEIEVNSASEYVQKLLDNYVVVDKKTRMKMIEQSIEKNCNTDTEYTVINKALLDEVANLIEYPYAIKGTFDKNYLELPEELIVITMHIHQRYFSVRNRLTNKLQNHFVFIRNGFNYSEKVQKGNEKVIEPRLSDAKFFYDEDLKHPLINNLEKMDNVLFQKDMGTLKDKILRMHDLADILLEKLDFDKNSIHKTIDLAKLDLVTNVINEKEFSHLQGYMGSIYAKKDGYSEGIVKGIKDQYLPQNINSKLPETIEGKIISIVDKLDTVVGCICVNLIPTSSKDPYDLRRSMMGLIMVLKDLNIDIDYTDLITKSIDVFRKNKEVLNENAKTFITNLFSDRLIASFGNDSKYAKILSSKNIKNICKSVEILKKLDNNQFDKLIQTSKRIDNLLQNIKRENIEYEVNSEDKVIDNLIKNFSIQELINKLDLINEYFDNNKIILSKNKVELVYVLKDKINNILKV